MSSLDLGHSRGFIVYTPADVIWASTAWKLVDWSGKVWAFFLCRDSTFHSFHLNFFFNNFQGISLISFNITKLSEDSDGKGPPLCSPSPWRWMSCLVLDTLLACVMVTQSWGPLCIESPTCRTWDLLLFFFLFLPRLHHKKIIFSKCSNTTDFCKNSDAFQNKYILF